MNKDGRARMVDLLEFREDGRGALAVANCGPQVPFMVRRSFLIYDVPAGTARGGHAHHLCEQFLICVTGAVDLVVEDETGTAYRHLGQPTQGLYVPALTWLTMQPAVERTVVLVLASDDYDPADYIRNKALFETLLVADRP